MRSGCAGGGYKPRLVFTSSIAVFGAPFPEAIGDEFFQTPLMQLRHPEGDRRTAARRLLAPRFHATASASGCRPFASVPACPTRRPQGSSPTSCASRSPARKRCCRSSEDVRHWHASPRSAVGFLIHAATMDSAAAGRAPQPHHARPVGDRRRADRGAEAGGRRDKVAATDQARARSVHHAAIVDGWPRNFDADAGGSSSASPPPKETFDDIIGFTSRTNSAASSWPPATIRKSGYRFFPGDERVGADDHVEQKDRAGMTIRRKVIRVTSRSSGPERKRS